VIESAAGFDRCVVASTIAPADEALMTPGAAMADWRSARKLLAFVGPEGGWGETELGWFQEAGVRGLTLGPNMLRIETAAIVIAGLAHGLSAKGEAR
jgi:16S rRNA (uracil1498-N3)-methyltransferase